MLMLVFLLKPFRIVRVIGSRAILIGRALVTAAAERRRAKRDKSIDDVAVLADGRGSFVARARSLRHDSADLVEVQANPQFVITQGGVASVSFKII